MRRIPLIILTIVLLSSLAAAGVFAQSGETSLDESTAALSIVETIATSAQMEVTLNGATYLITVPVTLNIDAQKILSDALLTTPTSDRVGDVSWKITAIDDHTEPYELNSYDTLQPAAGNKLVVITSQLTNLDSQPFSYRMAAFDRFAYDGLGNFYQEADYACDDINPSDTRTCVVVFEVPTTANILGLDVKVIDHKRIPYVTP